MNFKKKSSKSRYEELYFLKAKEARSKNHTSKVLLKSETIIGGSNTVLTPNVANCGGVGVFVCSSSSKMLLNRLFVQADNSEKIFFKSKGSP